MKKLFGEGLHPHADTLQATLVAAGATPEAARRASRLGRRFPRLVGAVLAERHDERAEGQRYLGVDVLTRSQAIQDETTELTL